MRLRLSGPPEMVVGRGEEHIRAVASALGVTRVLDDDSVCKVTRAEACRFGTYTGLIWITAAFTSDNVARISVSIISRSLTRPASGGDEQRFGASTFDCVLQRRGADPGVWIVSGCRQVSI